MIKYLIYAGIAALAVWSVWYVARHVRRQMKGRCGCGGDCAGCGGDCAACSRPKGKT